MAQLEASSEPRESPAIEGGDATRTPTQTPAEALPRILEEAGSVVEPQSTPRSTGSLLVSAAAEAEPSISHALLANQVPTLANFLVRIEMVSLLLTGMSSWS